MIYPNPIDRAPRILTSVLRGEAPDRVWLTGTQSLLLGVSGQMQTKALQLPQKMLMTSSIS
jgi:hypothetical protein